MAISSFTTRRGPRAPTTLIDLPFPSLSVQRRDPAAPMVRRDITPIPTRRTGPIDLSDTEGRAFDDMPTSLAIVEQGQFPDQQGKESSQKRNVRPRQQTLTLNLLTLLSLASGDPRTSSWLIS